MIVIHLISLLSIITFFEPGTSPGIIFTRLSEVSVSTNSWRICFHHDLSSFFSEESKVMITTSTLRTLCKQAIATHPESSTASYGKFIIALLDAHRTRMHTKLATIKAYSHHRNRRAPLEIIGTAAKTLFGILDAESAKNYDQQIDNLATNSNIHFDLLKRQTMLVENIIQHQKSSIEETQKELDRITQTVNKLYASAGTEIADLKITAQFNTLSSAVSMAMFQLETMADDIIHLLTNAIHGHTTNIIPIQTLQESLKKIASQLSKTETLPIQIERENILSIFQTSSLRTTLFDNRTLIEMSIPLISTTTFSMFRTSVIPFALDNRVYVITDTHEFFASDENQQIIIPLAEENNHICSHLNERIVCRASNLNV